MKIKCPVCGTENYFTGLEDEDDIVCSNCNKPLSKIREEKPKLRCEGGVKIENTNNKTQIVVPEFVTKRQTPSGTYEVYKGSDAESAKDFLKNKKVNENKYYIKVETPEGNWGVDIDGLYLERLVPFQLDINSAECEGSICGMPTPANLQYAVNGLVENFVVTVRCGKCSHKWEDGIRYKNMTVVRCPNCNSLNKVDSGPHIIETEMPGLVGFSIEI